jgi:hypothetical protein
MRERLITLGAALGALALFAAVLLQSGGITQRARDLPRPATDEQRADGYHAAFAWLETEGVQVVSLRERLTTLAARSDLRPSGNLLVVTLPGVTGFAGGELPALDHWIRAGNALLVLAALDDAPEWAAARAALAPADVNLLTGLLFEPQRRPGPRAGAGAGMRITRSAAATGEVSLLVPNGEHIYFHNVREAAALSDTVRSGRAHQTWALRIPYAGFALELAHGQASGAGVLWTRPLGAGRIVVSALGSLFTNRAVALPDNAQLLANVVAANVAPQGAVIFDDLRQGRGAVYDPARFYRDPRLYETLGILLALWLTWVLGSTPLRAPENQAPAPHEADLLHATGGLLARVVASSAAARTLFTHFLETVPPARAGGQRDPQRPERWEYLERHPRVSAAELERLKRWYADAHEDRRIPLRRLHDLIARIERRLRS